MKYGRMLWWAGYAACAAILYCAGAAAVYAQGEVGVKLQPATVEERADPGETINFTLKVTNISNVRQTYYFTKKNIETMTETGAPVFAQEGEPTGLELSEWIVLPAEPLEVDAGERATVPITVHVPKDATPGGHFAGIFVTLQPQRPEMSGTGIGFETGTLINIQVNGEVFEEAGIREFSTDKTLYGTTDVHFTVKVDNVGNVLVRPRGLIEIVDMFGSKVKTLVVNDLGSGIFPATSRTFEAQWKDPGFRMGRYQARVTLTYGVEEKRTITQTLTFWILPMNVVGPVLGGLLIITLIIYFGVRMHIKRKMELLHRARGAAAIRNAAVHHTPTSRLSIIAVALLIFTILFLIVLFLMFA